MSTKYTASATIPIPVNDLFQFLTDPATHHLFDASGMVGAPDTESVLTSIGQVFVMNMTYRSAGRVENYKSDNHVTAINEPYVLEWSTATHGGPMLGWRWRYELEQVGDCTRVDLSYDWSETTPQDAARFGVPLFDETALRSSLTLLASAFDKPA